LPINKIKTEIWKPAPKLQLRLKS